MSDTGGIKNVIFKLKTKTQKKAENCRETVPLIKCLTVIKQSSYPTKL